MVCGKRWNTCNGKSSNCANIVVRHFAAIARFPRVRASGGLTAGNAPKAIANAKSAVIGKGTVPNVASGTAKNGATSNARIEREKNAANVKNVATTLNNERKSTQIPYQ